MDYKQDLKINPDQLDVEWLEQPLLFHKYSAKSAEANQFVRKCEERVKMTRSQLILEASQGGEEVIGTGIKPTAANIEAYFRGHSDHIKAKQVLHEAEHEAEMLNSAVFAFHQRKSALENLTKLHGQNYFAGPTIPRDLSEEYKENQREGLREQKRKKTAEVVRSKQEEKPRSSRRSRKPEPDPEIEKEQEEEPKRRTRRTRSNT